MIGCYQKETEFLEWARDRMSGGEKGWAILISINYEISREGHYNIKSELTVLVTTAMPPRNVLKGSSPTVISRGVRDNFNDIQ